MTHLGYVIAAYGATFAVFAGLIVWVIADNRIQRARLRALEEKGARRRNSSGPA